MRCSVGIDVNYSKGRRLCAFADPLTYLDRDGPLSHGCEPVDEQS